VSWGSLARDDLARNVGHAINNPLGALTLTLDLAAEALGKGRPEPLELRVREALTLIEEAQDAARCIGAVVQDLKASTTPSHAEALAPGRRAAGRQGSSPPPSAKASRSTRPARVLVVDDDELVTRALVRVLGDCKVAVASKARDALARVEKGERFDVIVCDLMMPNMTGMDLYDAMMQIAPDQVERMIFLSGGAVTTRAREFAASVPNVLIEKPFDVRSLREIIHSRVR